MYMYYIKRANATHAVYPRPPDRPPDRDAAAGRRDGGRTATAGSRDGARIATARVHNACTCIILRERTLLPPFTLARRIARRIATRRPDRVDGRPAGGPVKKRRSAPRRRARPKKLRASFLFVRTFGATMSLNRSQCGGCSTEYDTSAAI
jgi:hypothetical protein